VHTVGPSFLLRPQTGAGVKERQGKASSLPKEKSLQPRLRRERTWEGGNGHECYLYYPSTRRKEEKDLLPTFLPTPVWSKVKKKKRSLKKGGNYPASKKRRTPISHSSLEIQRYWTYSCKWWDHVTAEGTPNISSNFSEKGSWPQITSRRSSRPKKTVTPYL